MLRLGRLNRYLKNKVAQWLRLDADYRYLAERITNLEKRLDDNIDGAVDVHYRGNTQIVILSRLNGGKVSIFDLNVKNMNEIHDIAISLLGRAWPNSIIDAPYEIRGMLERRKQFY